MLGKHESGVCSCPGPAPSSLDSGNIFYNAYEFTPQRQPRHPRPLPPSPLKFHLVSILLLKAGPVGAAPREGEMSPRHCHIDLEVSSVSLWLLQGPAQRTHFPRLKVRPTARATPGDSLAAAPGQEAPLPPCPPRGPGVMTRVPRAARLNN